MFFPDIGNGREPSVIYAIALSTMLFGRTLLATRLPTALGSAAIIFATFWIGRLFFGKDEESGRATPWRGLMIGGIGAGLMAVSVSQTILARTAYTKATLMPGLLMPVSRPALVGLERAKLVGDRTGRGMHWVVAVHIYASESRPLSDRHLCVELSFALAFFLLAKGADGVAAGSGLCDRVAGLVAAPILFHFALHPDHLLLRSRAAWVFDPVRSQGDPLGAFFLNAWEHLLAFGFRGDPHPRGNYAGQPLLNPWQALFFWLGAAMAARQWTRSTYRLLLLWLTIMMVPSLLARDLLAPTTIRIIGAAPAIYLLVGVGVWEVYRYLRERFSHKSEIWMAAVVGVAITALTLVQGVSTYRTYYQKWAVENDLYDIYGEAWADLAAAINAQPSGAGKVYLIPAIHRVLYNVDSFNYLYTGAAPVHFIDRTAPDLAQTVWSTLQTMEDLSTVKLVEGKSTPEEVGEDNGRFSFLLSKYGSYQGSEEYPIFTIHSYSDIRLDRPWTFYEQIEPLTIEYDGGITLQGVAFGQGAEQISSQPLLKLKRAHPMWMVLQWQIAPGLDADYAVSLRLYNADGQRAFQQDIVLWSPNHMPTSHWPVDAPVATMTLLDLPLALAPGEYELRMVVYDMETLVPTVEVGVWEPEVTLGRVRLAEVQ